MPPVCEKCVDNQCEYRDGGCDGSCGCHDCAIAYELDQEYFEELEEELEGYLRG
jgi:hypothetical protein